MYLHYLHISWCYVIKKNNMPFHTIIPIENPKHHLIPRFHFNQTNLCFVFILQNYQIDSAILLWNKSIHYVVICFEGKSKCILTFMPWWRHQMETFSALLPRCEGNPMVTYGFPSQRPATRSFEVFFDLHLNKQLRKQSIHRWFDKLSRSFWRHRNVISRCQAVI